MILNLSIDTETFTNLFFDLRNFFEKIEHEIEIGFFLRLFSVSCSVFSKRFLRLQNRLAKLPIALERLKITFTNSNVNLLLFL